MVPSEFLSITQSNLTIQQSEEVIQPMNACYPPESPPSVLFAIQLLPTVTTSHQTGGSLNITFSFKQNDPISMPEYIFSIKVFQPPSLSPSFVAAFGSAVPYSNQPRWDTTPRPACGVFVPYPLPLPFLSNRCSLPPPAPFVKSRYVKFSAL